jgi:hypothetical protein
MSATNGKVTAVSPYDAAIASASPAEQERLKRIRLAFNEPPESPMWGMYALVVSPMFAIQEQLVENRQAATLETKRAMDAAVGKIAAVAGGFEETLARIIDKKVVAALTAVQIAPPIVAQRELWRWPKTIAAVAAVFLALALASFSGAVSQHAIDVKYGPRMPHVPWVVAAQTSISTWPVLPFVVATAVLLVLLIVVGLRKSGPASRKTWPSRQ